MPVWWVLTFVTCYLCQCLHHAGADLHVLCRRDRREECCQVQVMPSARDQKHVMRSQGLLLQPMTTLIIPMHCKTLSEE
jgi:hypothetical protein